MDGPTDTEKCSCVPATKKKQAKKYQRKKTKKMKTKKGFALGKPGAEIKNYIHNMSHCFLPTQVI